jgi:4-hydroxy-tetrahydrodipicolinate reductase
MNWCAERQTPIVSGTTGLDDQQQVHLETAARRAPVFWAPNMSIGASLLIRLAADAASALGNDVEIEISETHHRDKIDAPSGTARALLESVCNALGRDVQQSAVYGRSGQCGPRKPGEIGVHALRIGRTIGRHEIQLVTDQETLTLRHSAQSRDAFAAGALRAVRWLVDKRPGLYGMSDLLPIRS